MPKEFLKDILGGIWKRRIHFENASNVFCRCYAGEFDYTGTRSRKMIIFWKKLGFKNVFHPQSTTKQVFSNSSGLKRVFEKLGISVDGRPNCTNKAAFPCLL